MFRCDFCENYKDKSECCDNPISDYGNICEECSDEHANEQRAGESKMKQTYDEIMEVMNMRISEARQEMIEAKTLGEKTALQVELRNVMIEKCNLERTLVRSNSMWDRVKRLLDI